MTRYRRNNAGCFGDRIDLCTGLCSFLRQDPGIIMIDEIRDTETAHVAVQAAITGHLVLSTLHTSDAPGTFIHFIDMGIPPYLIAATVGRGLSSALGSTPLPRLSF